VSINDIRIKPVLIGLFVVEILFLFAVSMAVDLFPIIAYSQWKSDKDLIPSVTDATEGTLSAKLNKLESDRLTALLEERPYKELLPVWIKCFQYFCLTGCVYNSVWALYDLLGAELSLTDNPQGLSFIRLGAFAIRSVYGVGYFMKCLFPAKRSLVSQQESIDLSLVPR